jgi:hypothetical protein
MPKGQVIVIEYQNQPMSLRESVYHTRQFSADGLAALAASSS